MVEPERGHVDGPFAPVVVVVESSARRIRSLIVLPFSSTEDKTSVGGDEFMEKIGTGWSGHIVELDPVAIAAESSARQTLSLIMVSFSSAEEKTRVGDDEFPEKNGTGWSGRIVELDPVAIAMESLPGRILSLMMLLLSSTEEKT